MTGMTIGQLAARGGVGVETVRFYQRRGLMPTPARSGNIRRYDGPDLARLRFIRSAQQAGFTLHQIEELVGLDAREDRGRVLDLAQARLAEIDLRIKELQSVHAALQGLASDCASGRGASCPILHAFEAP